MSHRQDNFFNENLQHAVRPGKSLALTLTYGHDLVIFGAETRQFNLVCTLLLYLRQGLVVKFKHLINVFDEPEIKAAEIF